MQDDEITLLNGCTDLVSLRKHEEIKGVGIRFNRLPTPFSSSNRLPTPRPLFLPVYDVSFPSNPFPLNKPQHVAAAPFPFRIEASPWRRSTSTRLSWEPARPENRWPSTWAAPAAEPRSSNANTSAAPASMSAARPPRPW